MIPCGLEAFSLNASFVRFFIFEKIDGNVPENSKIFRCMIFSNPGMIFAERDIQAPVQRVFDAPVLPDGIGDYFGVRLETGDKIGCFSG